jgi:5-methyltetrahydrofolate--homocysteine methyltransferase
MEVVSSEISSSNPLVDDLIARRDGSLLLDLCRRQIDLGADRLALNCGTRIDSEVEDMGWMVRTIHESLEVPLMTDTPNPLAIEEALKNNVHGRPVVDSISCERDRIEAIMPLVKRYDASVVVLLHGDDHMPVSVQDRLDCMPMVERVAREYAMKKEDMYLDCIMAPISVDSQNGLQYLQSLRLLQENYAGYRFACGVDNISYGMPEPEILNIAMAVMLVGAGQDFLFTNSTPALRAFLRAAKALTNQDANTLEYIEAFRKGELAVLGGNHQSA